MFSVTIHLVTTRPLCLLCRERQTVPGSGDYCHQPKCRHRAERAAEQAKSPIRVADLVAIQAGYAYPLTVAAQSAAEDVPALSGPCRSDGVYGPRVRVGKPPQVEDLLSDLLLYRAARGQLRAFNWSLLLPAVGVALVIGVWLGRGMW